MIDISDLYKRFADDRPYVLADLSLRVSSGELIFIYGRSGVGKTTLLRTIFALEKPDRGVILLAGRKVSALTPSLVPYLRRNIGFIFQNPSLIHNQTVFENVAVSLQIRGLSAAEIRSRTIDALEDVGLSDRAYDHTAILSGGEQQRVSIARAIVGKPAIVLADEPTGNLDPVLSDDIFELLTRLSQTGTAIVIASHNPVVVSSNVHGSVLELRDGRLWQMDRK